MFDFDAGKYAAFVWPAFAITAAVFAGLIAASLSHARKWRRQAEALRAKDGDGR